MPVSGNEEPGVLARQSSNSSCALPIKKRFSSMSHSRAPVHTDRLFSDENESKTEDSCDRTGKSDIPDSSLAEVKEERPLGSNVDSQPTMLPFLSISPETNPNTSSGPSRNVDDVVKQGESHSKLELPADSGKDELSLGPKKPHVSSLVDSNAEGISGLMSGAVNPSLLSLLSLNKGKDIFQEGNCKNGLNNNDVDVAARIDRANWDLNTPLDSWEGYGDVVPVQDASQSDPLRETSSSTLPMPLSDVVPDIDAKNENFDLKESNVSSDKVEASVSANMNVEDQTVHKKTQDTDNLVASGEESPNNEEKVSLSAGTEKECDGFDYESDGDHAFTRHVDTESVGCVREDEEYEDGEIREPMMQPIAEGMNSVHTESYDDSVKRRDEKADKMNLQSPLLDKEEKARDDEQRPIKGRSLSSRSGRENFYLPRNRDEMYGYGPQFVRGRFQDHSFGSSRGGFMRGRGRGSGRFHRLGRDFECYGGVADYRFRHKPMAPWIDGATFASNRRSKPFNDALPSFWHPPARRQSPKGREDAAMMYDTEFTTMQRRGFPRMWSKSPVRSHSRSSPQRRLTEGFNDHRGSSQHREDRIRSSPQRRDSSSYTARRVNDIANVDAVQEHVHPRSLSRRRRSPPDPVFITRNNRRADGESTDETRINGEGQGGPRQMRNVEEKERDEFDVSKLKKRRF